MRFIIFIFLALFISTAAITETEPLFHKPAGWPEPVYDFSKNPLRKEVIELGRHLFYDPILSRDSTISCASCHFQYTAFTHIDHDLSHGIEGRIGRRNSPALLNLAWSKSFMWDGAVNHLDVQALAPISNHLEMDESLANVILKLKRSEKYKRLFYAAFRDTVSSTHLLKSFSQFMLTLVSANSRYDQVMRGETRFNAQEERGYRLFRENCASCHKEPLFTNNAFARNGLPPDSFLHDAGLYEISKRSSDSLKFKVPSLRNIEFSFPYMHDGRFKTLMQVLDHYNSIAARKTDPGFRKKIVLNSNDKVDLTAFLLSLSDREFLFNPAFSFPR